MFSKIKTWGLKKWIIVIIIAYIFIKAVLPAITRPIANFLELLGFSAMNNSINKALANDNTTLSGGVVNQSNRNQVCLDVAEKLQVAIYDYTKFMGWWVPSVGEDEKAVIAQLNRLNNASEAVLVSSYYTQVLKRFDKTKFLKQDVLKYLDASQRAKIKSIIYNNLR